MNAGNALAQDKIAGRMSLAESMGTWDGKSVAVRMLLDHMGAGNRCLVPFRMLHE
jgi:hypothetical protein